MNWMYVFMFGLGILTTSIILWIKTFLMLRGYEHTDQIRSKCSHNGAKWIEEWCAECGATLKDEVQK